MRKEFLPFSKPDVSENAIQDVCDSIRSGWLAMGPKTVDFENKFATYTGAKYAISVNSATAGLHLAAMATVQIGDEVITTPMTFASTVNAIIYAGAKPVLVDIDPHTFNIDVNKIEAKITPRTRAIIPVHFAGRPCDMDKIEAIAKKHNLAIIEDSAHALGASYHGKRVGFGRGEKRIAVFSFHPTKNITTGEGGMVTTSDEKIAEQISVQRQNGMSKGAWNRFAAKGNANYDIAIPGLKYQMMDIQAAIGRDQMNYLEAFNARRTEIVNAYNNAFADLAAMTLPPPIEEGNIHAWHIYTPLLNLKELDFTRNEFMAKMKERNIGTAYHYQALHLFSAYKEITGLNKGDLPVAEDVSERIVSLPLFPKMTDNDVQDVIEAVLAICR